MIAKTYILRNLKHFDTAYKKANSTRVATYYSKIAILELSGWIEISMDDIVLGYLKRSITVENNKKYVREIVKKNSGFDYEANFRKMLISLIGISGCEKLEMQMNQPIHTVLIAELKNLKVMRNSLAHTYLKDHTVVALDAPSVTMSRFQAIYNGLKHYETVMKVL